jgi:hypothetical protein
MTELLKNQVFDFTSGAVTNAPAEALFADIVAGRNKIRGSCFGYLSDGKNLDQMLNLATGTQLPSPHFRAWVLVRRRDMVGKDGILKPWGKNFIECLKYVESLTYTNAKGKVLPITENDGLSLSWYEITPTTKKSKYVSKQGEEKEGTKYELGKFDTSEYTVAEDGTPGDIMIMVRSNFAPALSVKTSEGGIVELSRNKELVVRQAASKDEFTTITNGKDRELFDASFGPGRLVKVNFTIDLRLKDKSPQTSCYIEAALGFEDGKNQDGLIPRTIKTTNYSSGNRSATLSEEELALVGQDSGVTKVIGDDEIPF